MTEAKCFAVSSSKAWEQCGTGMCIGGVKPTNDAALKCMVGAHLFPLKLWDVLWLLQWEKQCYCGERKTAFAALLLHCKPYL